MQPPAAETRRELISLWNTVLVTDITGVSLSHHNTVQSYVNLDGAQLLFLGKEMCPVLLNPPHLLSCTILAPRQCWNCAIVALFPSHCLNLSFLYWPYWECSLQTVLPSSETQLWLILTLTGYKNGISKHYAKQRHHGLTNSICCTCHMKRKFFLQSSQLPLQYVSLKLLILFQLVCKSSNCPGFWLVIFSVKCYGHQILLRHFKQVIPVLYTHRAQLD